MLHLLDDPHWRAPSKGARVQLPPTKPALLLCYLALQNDWVPRGQLALLVRPDADSATALHAVRMLLNRAKNFSWAGALEVELTRVRFCVPVDVLEFRAALGRADWALALQTYKQPLLEHFNVEAGGLSEALDRERERLESVWLEAALALAAGQEASGDLAAAVATWTLCLSRNELSEEAVRGVMRSSYLSGRREAALEAYRTFEALLRLELNAKPAPATLDLLRGIENAALLEAPISSGSPVPPAILHPPRLIGRELEAVAFRSSHSRAIVVSGEPGVGKTRFLHELLPPNTRWLRGVDGLERLSLAPLLTFARGLSIASLEVLGAYRDDLARLLPELESSPETTDFSLAKSRLLEAFARLLEAEATSLAVDDLQWLDAATLECLTYTLARGKLRLYCTLRGAETTPQLERTLSAWNARTVRLEGLSLADTERLVSSLIGGAERFPVFSAWLHKSTGGNPFFALEVLKNLFETGRLHALDGEWHSVLDQISRDYAEFEVPATVGDLVLRRLALLPENAVRVAGAASVLGAGFAATMLQTLTGLSEDAVTDAWERLELAGVLASQGFRHDLTRQAIYASLSTARRRTLHARAAGLVALEPLRRADHALQADQPAVAVPWLLEAGTALNRRGLLEAARAVLERALACDPNRLETLALLAGIAGQLKNDDLATEYSRRVLAGQTDPMTRARALNVQAGLLYNAGRISEAVPVIEEAIRITVDLERHEADLEETAFDIFESEGRYADALAVLEPAVTRLRRYGDSGALSTCLSSVAAIMDDTERYAEALELHLESLGVAKRAGAGYAQVGAALHMMWALNHAGRAEEAVKIAREALGLGEYSNTEYLRNGLAASLMHLSRTDEAILEYQHNAEHGQVTTRALAWGRLASLYASTDRLKEARRAATRSLECALQTQVFFAQIRAAIAVLHFGSDEQVSRILPLVQGRRSPDRLAQTEFEAALAGRFPNLEVTAHQAASVGLN